MALGAITITAELDDTHRWALFVVSATGMVQATIYRVTDDGSQAVRGYYQKTVSETFNAADYEAPQNTSLQYFARVTDGVVTHDSAIITVVGVVDRGGDAVFNLSNPIATLAVNVVSDTEKRYSARRDVVEVMGRPDPVVVSDVRGMASGTLTLATLTDSDRIGLLSMLADGSLIAFSPRYPTYGFRDVWYLSIGDVTERRVSPLGRKAERYFDLEYQRIAPPPADFIGPAFATWGDIYNAGTTWGSVYVAGTTWQQIQVV